MDFGTLIGIGAVIVVIVALVILLFATKYKKVGPNEVLIISGGRKRMVVDPDGTKRRIGYRIQVGGGKLLLPFIHMAQVLSLEILTIETKTEEAYTFKGIPLSADGVAQVKVGGSEHAIRTAAEQFLSKGIEGTKKVSNQIIEGHVRALLGKLAIEEIYQDREGFSRKVMAMAGEDFKKLGLEILSFNLKEIRDTQGYLEALGRPKVAEVKRDAVVAEAETEKDSRIKASQAMKESEAAQVQAQAEIAVLKGEFEAKKAEYQVDINEKKARSDMAYELERHRMNQLIKKEEARVKMIEKESSILLEEKEIARREKELEATVKRPADARRYQIEAEAEAERIRIEKEAEGRSRAAKVEGSVDAELKKLVGEAEAEAMMKKAESWSHYNQAALYERLIEILPELAGAVAQPLSKVDKIVMVSSGDSGSGLGASKITGEVASVMAQLPTVLEALSGVDIKEIIKELPRIRSNKEEKTEGAQGEPEGPSETPPGPGQRKK